eukprot:1871243-Prymnesium_polylepis.3
MSHMCVQSYSPRTSSSGPAAFIQVVHAQASISPSLHAASAELLRSNRGARSMIPMPICESASGGGARSAPALTNGHFGWLLSTSSGLPSAASQVKRDKAMVVLPSRVLWATRFKPSEAAARSVSGGDSDSISALRPRLMFCALLLCAGARRQAQTKMLSQ